MFKLHITYPYRILTIASLGLGAILFFAFLNPYPTLDVKPAQQNSAILEEAMKGVTAQRFDKNGKLIQIVQMESWSHNKGQAITHMIAPCLTLNQQNGSKLTVSGKEGEGYQSKMGTQIDKLQLTHDVSIKQINPNMENFWELKTASLLFFPKDPNPTAQTDDTVTVYSPSLTIKAEGMRADLHRETIEFLHQVKTFYATPQV